MTNNTLEQRIEGAKRLLIVEDKLDNLVNGYEAARQRGYEVDIACDLEEALHLLGLQKYDGVITDMCFQEKGINGDSGNDGKIQSCYLDFKAGILPNAKLIKIPEPTSVAWTSAVDKSHTRREGEYVIKVEGFTSQDLRDKISEVSIPTIQAILGLVYLKNSYYFREKVSANEVKEGIRKLNSTNSGNALHAANPALGYFVVEEAIKRNIPISLITSTSHADHALPAVLATGLLSKDELLSRAKKGVSLKPSDYALANWKKWFKYNPEEYKRLGGDPNNVDVMSMLSDHFPAPYAFRKVILSASRKGTLDYNFAIDQIEGKIDQTTPYKLD